MPGDLSLEEQRRQAGDIYQDYGYFTTVASAIICWAVASAVSVHRRASPTPAGGRWCPSRGVVRWDRWLMRFSNQVL